MLTLYRYILLAIPFFILFPFVKNKKKFSTIYFLIYAILMFFEMAYALYIFIYVMKR